MGFPNVSHSKSASFGDENDGRAVFGQQGNAVYVMYSIPSDMAIQNLPFADDFPIKTSKYRDISDFEMLF